MDYLAFIDKAAQDKDYRARIKANPEQVVEEAGATLNGAKVKVLEDTAALYHIVLPADPNVALEDEALENTSGGLRAGDGGCTRFPRPMWGRKRLMMTLSCGDLMPTRPSRSEVHRSEH